MGYKPQLDSLRAIAVFGVLLSHFWLRHIELGHLGVRLFFVLSGFLITRQLLSKPPLTVFFSRRAARLLPAFYLALMLAWFLDIYGFRATWPWHVGQVTNVYVALQKSWGPVWPVGHFWTLNVEAQFYLLWPLVLLAIPKRRHLVLVAAMIAVGPLFRAFILASGRHELYFVLPPAQFDALGAGALLAMAPQAPFFRYGIFGLPFAIGGVLFYFLDGTAWMSELFELLTLLLLVHLVKAAYEGRLWLPDQIFPDIGRISYGIYLYHEILYGAIVRGYELPLGFTTFLLMTSLTMILSWASFHFFEAPIRNRLNRILDKRQRGVRVGQLPQ